MLFRSAAHADALEAEVQAVLATDVTARWVEAMDAAGVPGGPVLTYDQALAQDQVVARDSVVELEHPVMGTVRQLAPAARMSRTPPRARVAAPLLGQHSRDVLAWLGWAEPDIRTLEEDGVIETRQP